MDFEWNHRMGTHILSPGVRLLTKFYDQIYFEEINSLVFGSDVKNRKGQNMLKKHFRFVPKSSSYKMRYITIRLRSI